MYTKRQPIPRYANGYFFRSTLELAWACFFGRLGVSWKYEDYNVNGIWLPDFVLELSSLLYVLRKSFTFSIEELKSANVLKRHCSTILVEVKPARSYVDFEKAEIKAKRALGTLYSKIPVLYCGSTNFTLCSNFHLISEVHGIFFQNIWLRWRDLRSENIWLQSYAEASSAMTQESYYEADARMS